GIIVMRVEKSGIGDSQGGPCFDTDFGSESRNYSVALDTLCADPRVDPQRVFLFGHSIGTLIAPRLALAKPIAGLIIAAAAEHRRIADILNAQHPGSAEFKTVQGMDHHLEMMGTPQQAWDARVNQHRSGPYAEQLSSLIKDWICAKTKCS